MEGRREGNETNGLLLVNYRGKTEKKREELGNNFENKGILVNEDIKYKHGNFWNAQ